jgi:maltooligosyltrehalose trehalohydrolase
MKIGSWPVGRGETEFIVWAPFQRALKIKVTEPSPAVISLSRDAEGYFRGRAQARPGARYLCLLDDGRELPDPASHFQPLGVGGPSEVVDQANFVWKDADWSWAGLESAVLYELHVGTFTPEGTFEAVIGRLDDLRELGVTVLSLLPVAQFPGARNWGYDGVFPFAVQDSYGGPEGLKRLVDACHGRGLAVVLDVVYNHLGPEGSVLQDFGPFVTDRYRTPWGRAINFDQKDSDGVRNFFIQNALYWAEHFHADGLRLDAVHAIHDESARPFLAELSESADRWSEASGRRLTLIAESDLNDVRIITPRECGGLGVEAQFCDDFHHALHAVLTGERMSYYADFTGLGSLAKSFKEAYVLTGGYSRFRGRHYGSSTADRAAAQFIVFSQNHDQVGNRPGGERLSSLVPFEALKLAAGAVALAPYVPLLFMGEEYGETAPFRYFVSPDDPALAEAVRRGRREEWASLGVAVEGPGPETQAAFEESRLRWESRKEGPGLVLLGYYRELLRLRRALPALARPDNWDLEVAADEEQGTLTWRRWRGRDEALAVMNFGLRFLNVALSLPAGLWTRVLDSADKRWMGAGSRVRESLSGRAAVTLNPLSLVLLSREGER